LSTADGHAIHTTPVGFGRGGRQGLLVPPVGEQGVLCASACSTTQGFMPPSPFFSFLFDKSYIDICNNIIRKNKAHVLGKISLNYICIAAQLHKASKTFRHESKMNSESVGPTAKAAA
jgi:hypothetical protein